MTEEERIELLREVAKVAPKEMYLTFHPEFPCVEFCQGYGGGEVFQVVQGSRHTLENDRHDARLCFAMLDAMEARDLDGLGPEVVIELCGSGTEWYCRRWVCPESDSPHKSQEGTGKTRAEAIARAFVQVFQTHESPAR